MQNASATLATDCYVVSDQYSGQNNCGADVIEVGEGVGGNPVGSCGYGSPKWCTRRGLLRFGVSSIPDGSQVTSATLQLTAAKNATQVSFNVAALNNATTFDGNATWRQYNATCADPCWLGGAPTTVQGRTLVPANVSSQPTLSWSLSPGLVESWINGGSADNHGIVLAADPESRSRIGTVGHVAQFISSENSNPALRPKLVIAYTPPSASASAPTMPTNLAPAAGGTADHHPTLSATYNGTTTGSVEYQVDSADNALIVGNSGQTADPGSSSAWTVPYRDSGFYLAKDQQYKWRARGVNSLGSSAWTAWRTFTISSSQWWSDRDQGLADQCSNWTTDGTHSTMPASDQGTVAGCNLTTAQLRKVDTGSQAVAGTPKVTLEYVFRNPTACPVDESKPDVNNLCLRHIMVSKSSRNPACSPKSGSGACPSTAASAPKAAVTPADVTCGGAPSNVYINDVFGNKGLGLETNWNWCWDYATVYTPSTSDNIFISTFESIDYTGGNLYHAPTATETLPGYPTWYYGYTSQDFNCQLARIALGCGSLRIAVGMNMYYDGTYGTNGNGDLP